MIEEPEEVEVLAGPGGEEKERPALRALWERRSARGRAVIAATTVAVLALGGTVAYAATSGGSADGSASATSPSSSSSSSPSEGPGHGHDRGGPGFMFGVGGDAAHGEATVKDRDTGEWVVRVWQRGTVEKVDGDQVGVKSEDGVSWTWTVGSDVSVHTDGTSSDSGAGALKKGDTVFVIGSRSDGTYTATRVMSGDFTDRGPNGNDRRGGFPGHGPWDRGDDRSPSPTSSGAPT
ncbi:hypothetical protein OG562_00640 [Streptomyces sp. NBC_01275]|uniref:hypothetical protein n=1 Tax=Streptomyces sp. NBC_01275 TaxID=2903807 RepID=UPI00224D0CA4|nr:hypothetical protein [Streptomyces sp. NBC_01275]MCX4759517.1 hypothetical protein [Streptomyces sp. NBC_01275]